MSGPMEGIRVLEVAMYGFVPSAGAVLADWGADVLKVEHAVTGDPQRGLRQTGAYKIEGDPNPNFEHANRGKRSIGLDVSTPEGVEVLYELAARSDVFLTNFLPGARQRFKIDVEDIRKVSPSIIYARGHALAVSLHLDKPWVAPLMGARGAMSNPLSGLYKTADGRYLSLVMLQPGKYWADVCRHIGRPELADDPRFDDAAKLDANCDEACEILAEAFAGKTLAEWAEILATVSGPWAPVQDTLQAGKDAQARANEYFLQAGELELVSGAVT